MTVTDLDREALRALVREVLRDVVPGVMAQAADRAAASGTAAPPNAEQAAPRRHAPAAQRSAPAAQRSAPAMQPSAPATQRSASRPGPRGETVETVTIRSDADLDAFVRRLLRMFDNPKQRADIRAGKLRFALAQVSVPGVPVPTRRIEKGAVTEAQIKDAAKAGARLVLGRRAVLTPLARDKARALGVVVEREA